MPNRIATPCAKPGCPAATYGRFCDTHSLEERRRYAARRPGWQDYGPQWRQIRRLVLLRDPLCRDESGCAKPSTDVDHITPRRQGGADALSNLRGLCHEHHSAKTASRDGGWGNRRR